MIRIFFILKKKNMVEVYDDLIFVEMIGFEVGVHVDAPWKINGCQPKKSPNGKENYLPSTSMNLGSIGEFSV